MSLIGKEEYNKHFCEERLDLQPGDRAALLTDHVNRYTKTVSKEGGHDDQYAYGCCRVPEGATKVSRTRNCIYAPEYESPSLTKRLSYFLKRFK